MVANKHKSQRGYRQTNRAKGLCFCGRPAEGRYSSCVTCRTQGKEQKSRRFFQTRATMLNWNHDSNISAQQLARLWHRQRGLCALSGERLNKNNAHLDHIVPLARGGETALTNLRWLHEVVNHAKWTFSDSEFLSFCRKVIAHAATK